MAQVKTEEAEATQEPTQVAEETEAVAEAEATAEKPQATWKMNVEVWGAMPETDLAAALAELGQAEGIDVSVTKTKSGLVKVRFGKRPRKARTDASGLTREQKTDAIGKIRAALKDAEKAPLVLALLERIESGESGEEISKSLQELAGIGSE